MVIYSVYIISKSGGLIYSYDHATSNATIEKTFSYPLDFKLEYTNQRVQVVFGQCDGIKVGHSVLAINGELINGRKLGDKDVLDEILSNEQNYPISIKFGIQKLSANEKIFLASMFHSMYAIAALQIYNVKSIDGKTKQTTSSGIETLDVKGINNFLFLETILENDNFKLNCFQTVTGVKFLIITDLNSNVQKDILLRKIYELYSDYVLKNPFYSLDMPIRCELFDTNLQQLLETAEKTGLVNA